MRYALCTFHYAHITLHFAHSTSGKSPKLPRQVTTMLAAGDSRRYCMQCRVCIKQSMRHCEIQVIKLRIKLIAVGWYWVTTICWCQTNPEIHCSLDMHNFQDKHFFFFYLLSEIICKNYPFWFIHGAVFLDTLCL